MSLSDEINDGDFYYVESDLSGYSDEYGQFEIAIKFVMTILKYLNSTDTCKFSVFGLKDGQFKLTEVFVTSTNVYFVPVR